MPINIKKFLRVTALIFFLIFFVLSVVCAFLYASFARHDFFLGVDFVPSQAKYLGLDWQKAYLQILDDLQVKKIRLSAHWNDVEPIIDEYNFSELDFMMNAARQRGVEVVLALGRRTPRYPECHDPFWLKDLSPDIVRQEQLEIIAKTVQRYKDYQNLTIWQVENEPMLDAFGVCPKSDLNFLRKEAAYVKTLDSRPILITDSGELSFWFTTANIGEYFGTTMYRVAYNSFSGYMFYGLPPIYYTLKAWLNGKDLSHVFVSELQAEPWSPKGVLNSPLEEQFKSMNPARLRNHINYAKRIGFAGAYLWGAEWWLYLKERRNDSRMWDTAREVFQVSNQ